MKSFEIIMMKNAIYIKRRMRNTLFELIMEFYIISQENRELQLIHAFNVKQLINVT